MTGLKCSMWPTWTIALRACAAASTCSASASEAQIGFSIKRWQPCASSGSATAACRSVGTTIETASQAAPNSSSESNRRQPWRTAISSARAALAS